MASFLRSSRPGSAAGVRFKSPLYKRLAAVFCCLLLAGAFLAGRTGRPPHPARAMRSIRPARSPKPSMRS